MDELDVMLRKNRLDIMIIKASAEVEKTNNKVKKEGLEVLMDILELIHDLQHEIRQNYKEIAKLKYEIYFLILSSHITVFFCGCVFSLLIEKYNNKNEKKDFK